MVLVGLRRVDSDGNDRDLVLEPVLEVLAGDGGDFSFDGVWIGHICSGSALSVVGVIIRMVVLAWAKPKAWGSLVCVAGWRASANRIPTQR